MNTRLMMNPDRESLIRVAGLEADGALHADAILIRGVEQRLLSLFAEGKLFYGLRVGAIVPDGFALERTDELFPTTRIRPECAPDLTVLCYGGMLVDVEKALDPLFDLHEIACEIICPTRLYPLDVRPIIESVERTGRLLVVEEGIGFAAFGAEVVARVVELAPGALHRLRRLAAPEHPIPACGPLEKALLPGPAHIVAAALELFRS